MVEKHKMTASFEQLKYSSLMLREEWTKMVSTFNDLANNGWTDNAIIELITYISISEFGAKLFPGSSLGTLLISKPIDGRLNYQTTLGISFDKKTNKFVFSYSDWDSIDNREDYIKAIIWKQECQKSELKTSFIDFIKWNETWDL